ncbi:MAG TPA: nitronate monooxygenase [Flavobacteriales bacterium]|nr:nitronate monooxygenase [Flavobacteriales bacterium]
MTPSIANLLGIKYPLIIAPMFLVSDTKMVIEALKSGCTAAIPALNYRTQAELRTAIREIRSAQKGPIGINLIVNKSNMRLSKDLAVCLEEGIDFYITSLGSPKEVIEKAHKDGKLVFCDVVNAEYALKVEKLGADAVIAVNNEAGGHAGKLSMIEILNELKNSIHIPIISAGGIAEAADLNAALEAGASGVSVGTVFIASDEAPVSQEYKNALIEYGAKDIVMTTKLSGTPCTVIKTPYVEKTGTEPNWIEKTMNRYKGLKKLMKMILFVRGMKKLRSAAFDFTYKKVWCAGPSIEKIKEIRPIRVIIADLVRDLP